MPACRGASLGSHSASTIKGSCWGFPIPTWACRRAKETPRFLARGSGSPRKDTPPPCVPAKPGLPAGPEPGGVGEGSPGPGCVCACVPLWAWRGCRRRTDPVPHPHTDAVSPKFPRRKPPDAAKCCWPVVSLAGGSQSRGPPSPQGLCTCVRVAAAVCVHRGQHTLTHSSVQVAFTHVCLCYACVMYTHPRSSQFGWFTPTQRWGFPDSSVVKDSTCNAGDPGSIPGSGRSAGKGVGYALQDSWASLMAQLVKNLPAVRETWVQYLAWEDPLEKGKAAHSSILAWRIPGTV